MMGLGDGLDFLRNPPPSPANRTPGKAERGLPREAEAMAAAGAAPTAETAAAVQTAASYSTTTNPSHSFNVVGEERNIDPQCNVEWPADWFIEEPRAIHQDWPMNSKFDLNMDCNIQQEIDVDDSFRMDDILGGDIEYVSDRQKGLIAAVHLVFPDSCHRYCLRHIYANFMSAGHKNGDLKKLVDRAAYAFDKYDFDVAMEEFKTVDKEAWEWFCKIPPMHWARHAFDTSCKTDLVVNNISEVFNSYILKVRDKPIVTMIESIRTKLMARFATKREGVENVQWEITPTYVERLEWEKTNARWCTNIVCSKKDLWQVTHIERTYEVNLAERTCGCFKWDLTGIPCKHAIATTLGSKKGTTQDREKAARCCSTASFSAPCCSTYSSSALCRSTVGSST